MKTRITEMLGIEIPIVQAPMGWIARSPLASAVSNAGGLGIIETSSGELDILREEIARLSSTSTAASSTNTTLPTISGRTTTWNNSRYIYGYILN